jgi:hypothetical protein
MITLKIYNQLKKILPTSDRHDFEYTINEVVGFVENASSLTKSWHGQLLNNDFLKYKTSDTIFILGSGPSINLISNEQWDHISKCNSIGFNYWLVHDFVPTFFMYQGVDDSMLNLLSDSISKYKDVPFILRGTDIALGRFNTSDVRLNLLKRNPVYFLNSFPISSMSDIEIIKLIEFMQALGFFNFGEISRLIPKFRSSLGLLISLSYQMGYKKIVLCGMDMQDSRHFWDSELFKDHKAKYGLPREGAVNIGLFTDGKYSKNTVPEYVYSLKDWMFNESNVEITLLNSQSVLYPNLKIYEL